MTVCLVFDIDDTIYVHKSNDMNYDIIRPDYQMKSLLQRIKYPKFVLTNANTSLVHIPQPPPPGIAHRLPTCGSLHPNNLRPAQRVWCQGSISSSSSSCAPILCK